MWSMVVLDEGNRQDAGRLDHAVALVVAAAAAAVVALLSVALPVVDVALLGAPNMIAGTAMPTATAIARMIPIIMMIPIIFELPAAAAPPAASAAADALCTTHTG